VVPASWLRGWKNQSGFGSGMAIHLILGSLMARRENLRR
jgi:hypothetical protein